MSSLRKRLETSQQTNKNLKQQVDCCIPAPGQCQSSYCILYYNVGYNVVSALLQMYSCTVFSVSSYYELSVICTAGVVCSHMFCHMQTILQYNTALSLENFVIMSQQFLCVAIMLWFSNEMLVSNHRQFIRGTLQPPCKIYYGHNYLLHTILLSTIQLEHNSMGFVEVGE